jgi:peptide/nickel transport system permease protein
MSLPVPDAQSLSPVPALFPMRPLQAGSLRSAWRSLLRQKSAFTGLCVLVTMVMLAVFSDFFASSLPLFVASAPMDTGAPAMRQTEQGRSTTYLLANLVKPDALRTQTPVALDALCERTFCIRALVKYGPRDVDARVLLPPFRVREHPLGTDSEGRDVFAVAVHGLRAIVSFALLAVLILVSIGTFLGSIGGFFGGSVDAVIARAVETMTAFPTLVLVLAVQAVLPHASTITLLFAIGLTRWSEVARVVRAEVLDVMNEDYVLAARALGASQVRVLARHVLPNARGQVIVSASFALSAVVLLQASCDFLGLGVEENLPTWGHLMGQVRRHADAWWLLAVPSLLLLVLVVSQTIVSEALSAALDPKSRTS